MKKKGLRKIMGITAVMLLSVVFLNGCGKDGSMGADQDDVQVSGDISEESLDDGNSQQNKDRVQEGSSTAQDENLVSELEVRFGDDGESFMMHMEENETAAAIIRYVGTSDWRLPIYERSDGMDYDVLQYYDIPSRYEIPSNGGEVTEAKAGDVFYSDPNRIVLYYHDAEISEEYTKIGTFEATDEFITAVEENPVLEGWGNKIILISQP